jgi:hypothetical protein
MRNDCTYDIVVRTYRLTSNSPHPDLLGGPLEGSLIDVADFAH